jgi:hypothetical protein
MSWALDGDLFGLLREGAEPKRSIHSQGPEMASLLDQRWWAAQVRSPQKGQAEPPEILESQGNWRPSQDPKLTPI